MIEVRFHGRGGQGAVMASRILANAFVRIGKYGAAFPMFGFERRGAPVTAFGRFDDKPIVEKTQIYNPNVLVILDPSQKDRKEVYNGLVENSILVLNYNGQINSNLHENFKKIGVVDAEKIAMEEIGIPIPNTPMLGAFAATTKLLTIEPIIEALSDYFSGKKLEMNIKCVERGYKETKVIEF